MNEEHATKISEAFLRRIGLDKGVQWNPAGIDQVIAHSHRSLPFDNLSVFDAPDTPLTWAYIVDKTVGKGHGGLCYELNGLLNLVMREQGLAARLVMATIFDTDSADWFSIADTHVMNIVECEDRAYLVDIGFGLRSPRTKVPLDGAIATFQGDQYRVTQDASFYYLNSRKSGDAQWSIGYRFPREYRGASLEELERVRQVIVFDENSPFNKSPLVAIFTADGSKVLTPSSYTVADAAGKTKHPVAPDQFRTMLQQMTTAN